MTASLMTLETHVSATLYYETKLMAYAYKRLVVENLSNMALDLYQFTKQRASAIFVGKAKKIL